MRSLARCERLIFYVSPRYSEKRRPSAKSSLPLFDSGFSLEFLLKQQQYFAALKEILVFMRKNSRKNKALSNSQEIDAIIISFKLSGLL